MHSGQRPAPGPGPTAGLGDTGLPDTGLAGTGLAGTAARGIPDSAAGEAAHRAARGGHAPAAPGRSRRRGAALGEAALWGGAALVLLAFFVKVSYGARIDADGANIALQGWDFIHGHVVMHGWLPGDATYYGYEVPLLGLTELVFGLGARAAHVASALAYLIVAGLAVALAVIGARGVARPARAAVVVAIMAAPLLTVLTVWTMLEEPDHPGTAVFILLPALLIDRLPGRKLVPPVLAVILCAGQISDATVKYVVVPAIVVVCAYRLLASRATRAGTTRWWRSSDAAVAVAAVASVALEYAVHAVLLALDGYQTVTPHNKIGSPGAWPGHAATTWLVIRELFGAVDTSYTSLGAGGAAFGLLGLLAAIAGLGWTAWTWRRASWADQLLTIVIVAFAAIYVISAVAQPDGYREISEVLPCGAVLAARALVPARITRGARVLAVAGVTAAAALFPLAVAASRPAVGPALGPAPGNSAGAPIAPLASWLEAHGLTYGLSDYWSSSTVTLQSGNRVKIRAISMVPTPGAPSGYVPHAPYWETNALWYDPSRNDATFVVARMTGHYSPAFYEGLFGPPVATYHVTKTWTILDYQRNLLRELPPMLGLGVGPKS
jgi:hypothetical protein